MPNMNVEQMVEELSSWTVMEVANLVEELEEKWGVSAAPAAVAVAGTGGGGAAEAAEEQTEFDVELTEAGAKKINVIKAIREITSSAWRTPRPGGSGSQSRQGGRFQGRGRRNQEEARRSWREGHRQVTAMGLFLGALCRDLAHGPDRVKVLGRGSTGSRSAVIHDFPRRGGRPKVSLSRTCPNSWL